MPFESSTGSAPVQQVQSPLGRGDTVKSKNAKLEAEYNAAMANWQWQNQIELLNYQNAYNSPVEQMARYAEAGINPNLVAGNGDAGNMGSAPTPPSADKVDSQSIPSISEDISRYAGIAAQLASVASGIQGFAKTAADIENTKTATDLARQQKILDKARFGIDLGRYHLDVNSREYQNGLLAQQIRQLMLGNDTYRERFAREGALNDAQIREINSRINRSDALLPYEITRNKHENERMRLSNILLQGDVDFDNIEGGTYGRLRRLSNINYHNALVMGGLDALRDGGSTDTFIRRGISHLSSGFQRASDAYNGLVTKLADGAQQLINASRDRYKKAQEKYPYQTPKYDYGQFHF